jgi:RHS repeat-associated protein
MVKAYDVTDLLGSERELFAENAVLARYEYDPYGNQSIDGTRAGDRGFAGYFKLAATGLDLTSNRVYSPPIGRWLTRDPIGATFRAREEGEAVSVPRPNLYTYVRNNPMSLRDPSGLQGLAAVWVEMAVPLWEEMVAEAQGFSTAQKVGAVASKVGTGLDIASPYEGSGTLVDCGACLTALAPACASCIVGLLRNEKFPNPGPPNYCDASEWDFTYGPLPPPCSDEPVCR